LSRRTFSVLGTLVLASTLGTLPARTAPPDAAADPAEKAACVAAYDAAQRARAASHFRAARDALVTCARTSCPSSLQKDCAKWLDQLEEAQPTVVIAARKGGADVEDVRVSVDGQNVASHLAGSALRVDPGERVFRFEHGRDPVVEQVVVIREGEKARRLEVSFDAAHASEATQPVPATTRPTPVATYVALGIGGAGMVLFGVFGGYGLSQKGALNACRPDCAESQVDAARRSFDAADIALTAGLFSLGWAAVIYLTRPEHALAGAPQLGLVPGGAVAGVGGRF
jgi:hypothetical protein